MCTDACECVLGTEIVVAWCCICGVTVVDAMASEVMVYADGTAGAGIAVLYCEFRDAAVYPLSCIEEGSALRAGI